MDFKKENLFFIFLIMLVLFTLTTVSAEDEVSADIDNSIDIDNKTESNIHLNIDVNYEYSNDNKNIVTDFKITSDGRNLPFEKAFDNITNQYILKLSPNTQSHGKYTISALTAGYITQSKNITINSNSADVYIGFEMKATDAYKLGYKVTESADKALDFKTADDILVITTAGIPKYNGITSEDAIEAILNSQYNTIAYSNVLMLRQSAYDKIAFAFVVKKGNLLNIAVFENSSTDYCYLGTISEDMTREEWNKYFNAVTSENAWAFASLANGWNAGVPKEILQEAAFHGHICEGTLGGFSIVKALLYYYPPIYMESTIDGKSPAAGDLTSYKVLGLPGGSDDDAVLFFLDATIGKSGYVGIDTTSQGAEEGMLGFIRWNSQTYRGDVIVLKFDSNKTKKLFTQETGINPDAGSLEELKYCSWWINKINTNPIELVEVCYEGTNLTYKDYYYLVGSAANTTDENEDLIEAVEGHGLDLNYIKSLNLPKPQRSPDYEPTVGNLTDAEMEQIGIDAANIALKYFKDELNITVGKDEVDFAVLTDAGYVYINGQETSKVRDGLYKALGATLYSKTLLQHHQALWKPLHFMFLLSNRSSNSNILNGVYLRYNPTTKDFFVGKLNGSHVADIGIDSLNNSFLVSELQKTFITGGQWFNIQTISNTWNANPKFDQLATFLYHAHVCPGVQPGFFITDYLQKEYPLGENESYTYFGSSIYCKDDSMTYLLPNVSPGMGTYFVQKLKDTDTESKVLYGGTDEGVFVIWDDELNIGRAVVVSFKWADIDTSSYKTSDAKRAAQIRAYIDLYNGNAASNPDIKSPVEVSSSNEKWITREQFDLMKKGVSEDSNVLNYIKNLPFISKEDLIQSMNGNGGSADNDGDANSNSESVNGNTPSSSKNNPGTSTSGSQSVGEGSDLLAATATVENVDSQSEDSKSYEVSNKTSKNVASNSNNLLITAIGVLIIGLIVGIGYVRNRRSKE